MTRIRSDEADYRRVLSVTVFLAEFETVLLTFDPDGIALAAIQELL